MLTLTAVALSAALLAAHQSFSDGDGPDTLERAEAFTTVANVLGAATACDQIPHDRVSAAARQVGTLATAQAISVEQVVAIERLLIVSAAAGRQAVVVGQADCSTVEDAFAEVEQVVLQTPVALRGESPVPRGLRGAARMSPP